ncbi:MlaD family protein [Leadbettera azotonutricia]|uniref:Mce-like protein n=1 Tax=Leadbettera azotonutricia (strain ATCC BAA-888 / DSM 13862 / ZAS-9) TaxID=545695 RepID=F5Y8F4_LEAAZ|nr:MlaD family protein [Leadbettera azotonutricia]AEF81331.1 Mce-like protein [Leadbettera azotonutricia ZAS-9]
MKFRIRFADQIVGIFIILALASLVFIIVMLGSSQRWFAKDYSYHSSFVSAAGLSKNMPVLYRGFTIGNVQSFGLAENDQVEVVFRIQDLYVDRVRKGSMVELMVSPIGLGNQFLFHAGKGEERLAYGDFVPAVGSAEARDFIRQGLADEPRHDDSISLLLNRASSVMDAVNRTLFQVNEALITGTDSTAIGRIVGGVDRTVAGLETIPGTVNRAADTILSDVDILLADIDDVKHLLDNELERINPILADLNTLSSELANPSGVVMTALDTSGPLYLSIVDSLNSVSGILDNLDRTTAFIPGQMPALAGVITDLRVTLKTAEDVLVALTNNPLLRKGIPERVEVQSSGTSPRDIQF